MAYHDTLFQLGMDLTRSSTAQKEDLGEAALFAAQTVEAAHNSSPVGRLASVAASSPEPAPRVTRAESARNEAIGTHVTIDIHGSDMLRDLRSAVATLTRLVDAAGASLQHLHVHPVGEGGAVSGVAVLQNGHIAFHSRPEIGYAALDISTFGGAATHVWTLAARSVLDDARIATRVHVRGETAGEAILSAVLPARRGRAPVKMLRARAA
jgi:S-adenosylmethionine decarboxylase